MSEAPAWALSLPLPRMWGQIQAADHLPGALQLGVSGLLSLKQLLLPTAGCPL